MDDPGYLAEFWVRPIVIMPTHKALSIQFWILFPNFSEIVILTKIIWYIIDKKNMNNYELVII